MAAWAKDKAVKDRDRVVPKAVVRAWGKAKAVKVRVVGKVAAWAKAAKVRAPVLEAGEAKRRRVRAPEREQEQAKAKAKVEPREEIPPVMSAGKAKAAKAKGPGAGWPKVALVAAARARVWPGLEAVEAKRRRAKAPDKPKGVPREEIPPGTSEARGVRAKGRAARWRAKAHKAVARVARRPEKVAR